MSRVPSSAAAKAASKTELWDSVCSPAFEFTRPFEGPGGFKGRSINATYLIRCATELWGPIGQAWKHQLVSERQVQGAPILGRKAVIGKKAVLDRDGKLQGHQDAIVGHEDFVIGHEIAHHFTGKLIYPGGAVDTAGSSLLVRSDTVGLWTDPYAVTKARTAALSKGLSQLGFGAEIHMGMWDDDDAPVIATATAPAPKTKAKKASDARSMPAPPPEPPVEWWTALRDRINGAETIADVQSAWKEAQKQAKAKGDTVAHGLLKSANEQATKRLTGA